MFSNKGAAHARLSARKRALNEAASRLANRSGISEAARQNLVEDTQRELTEIDSALARLEAGMYGQCEGCGGPIGHQRLLAIPESRYCISCTSALNLP